MPSFEWNKIIASVLTAMIVAMVVGILASQIVRPRHLEKAVYLPPGAEGGATAAATSAAPPKVEPIGPFLAKADPKKGEQVAKVCLQCHSFAKGQPNKIGPNLYGVMDEKIAAVPGYQFSSALSAHKDEKWDPAKLNVWLDKPQDFAKGTKMTFPGLPKEQDRADVIAYLLTDAPNGAELLKKAKEQAEAEVKQPAGGANGAPAKPGEKAPEKPANAGGGAATPPAKAAPNSATPATAPGTASSPPSASAKPGSETSGPNAGGSPAANGGATTAPSNPSAAAPSATPGATK